MALTSSSESGYGLNAREKEALIDIARRVIRKGIGGERLEVDIECYTGALAREGASFVTLHVDEKLRGCIGSLEAERVLVLDVAHNAYAAAFRDPRFDALTGPEFDRLALDISLVNVPVPMRFASEDDLLRQLRPGVDGLILEEGAHRGTFLPSVWEMLPEPRDFLRQLKRKAGLTPEYWSPRIAVRRYTVESVE